MSIFSTRNSDGASGLAEPTSTIKLKEYRKLQGEAKRNGCDSVSELVSAPTTRGAGGRNGFDPRNAREN